MARHDLLWQLASVAQGHDRQCRLSARQDQLVGRRRQVFDVRVVSLPHHRSDSRARCRLLDGDDAVPGAGEEHHSQVRPTSGRQRQDPRALLRLSGEGADAAGTGKRGRVDRRRGIRDVRRRSQSVRQRDQVHPPGLPRLPVDRRRGVLARALPVGQEGRRLRGEQRQRRRRAAGWRVRADVQRLHEPGLFTDLLHGSVAGQSEGVAEDGGAGGR